MENINFVIEKTFNVPREQLFKIWTDKDHLKNWFAPKGFTVQYIKFELRPNGTSHYCITSHEGKKMYGVVIYKEISSPTKLTYLQHFADEKGNITSHSITWPKSLLTTIAFSEENKNHTKLTLTWTPIDASKEEIDAFVHAMPGMTQGWNGTFESLENYLKKLST